MLPTNTPNVPFNFTSFSSLDSSLLSQITPGAFPGQSLAVGDRISPFPAAGSAFQVGSQIVVPGAQNKSGPDTHQPIITKLSVDSGSKYVRDQAPGDITFVCRNPKSLNANICQTLNLAQMNEVLRNSFRATSLQRPSPAIANHVRDYLSKGERYLNQMITKEQQVGTPYEESALIASMLNNPEYETLLARSSKAIFCCYNFVGIRTGHTNYATETSPGAISIQMDGATQFAEPWNVWGQVKSADRLFLILRRRYDPATKKYEEFQLVPHATQNVVPSHDQLYYEDDAGYPHLAWYYNVGQIWQEPLEIPSPEIAAKRAGLTVGSVAANRELCATVAIVAGALSTESELYAN